MGFRSLWLGFCGSSMCSLPGRLDGRVAVVTGANTGMGLSLTAELAMRGARVIMACRKMENFQTALDYLLSEYGENSKHLGSVPDAQLTPIRSEQLLFEQLRLCTFEDVKRFATSLATKESTVHFLVNNAGVLLTSTSADDELTQDGFNRHFQINYLSPVLLTLYLLPLFSRDNMSRIVFTSSVLRHLATIKQEDVFHTKTGLLGGRTYSHSKLLITAFANRLAKHLNTQNIRVVSVDPGIVRTNLVREPGFIWNFVWNYLFWRLRKEVHLGVQCALHTVLDPDLISGAEYCNCVVVECSQQMKDEKILDAVWNQTLRILMPFFIPAIAAKVEKLFSY
ncbi:Retinol dehydrogenase 12 [Fasciola hepatica]|uniref:Retinol dehydrogenase 12 n=1 Tax=Fasciola hepatica TaxID=6192 RepID=A0A4E0R4U4_FASHE|nr:Retinol dehydrogenase 12 [Fasciola hepatica]